MLATRLSVSILIVVVISVFTANRPQINSPVITTSLSDDGSEESTVISIGPVTIKTDQDEALSSTDTLEVDAPGGDDTETKAMVSLGEEIAQQLVALEIDKTVENKPDRLSEEEIKSLVVQRLLSVRSQMNDAGPMSANLSGAAKRNAGPAPAPASNLERVEGDFSGKSLMGTDFRNKDLSGLDFSSARLTAARFDGSNLTGANFAGAKIHGASFADTRMDGIDLTHAQAQTAHFERASMTGADLSHANFAGAVLTGADMRGAIMEDVNLNGANMQDIRTDKTP